MPFLALIPREVWIGLLVALAAFGAYWKITSDAEDRGAATVTTKIERANEKAEGWADDAERTVENCTGTWDRARGVCVREGTGAGN
jgi:hypothetical protein